MTPTCHSLSDLQGRSLSDNDTHVTLSVNRHSCSKAVAETAASIVRSAQRLTSSRQSKSQNDIPTEPKCLKEVERTLRGRSFNNMNRRYVLRTSLRGTQAETLAGNPRCRDLGMVGPISSLSVYFLEFA